MTAGDSRRRRAGRAAMRLIAAAAAAAGSHAAAATKCEMRQIAELHVVNDQSHGVGAATLPVWIAAFDSVSFGGEQVQKAQLEVSPVFDMRRTETGTMLGVQLDAMPDMLLGADFLRSHRMVVATDQSAIYFTYTGGQVFQPWDVQHRP